MLVIGKGPVSVQCSSNGWKGQPRTRAGVVFVSLELVRLQWVADLCGYVLAPGV